MNENKKGHNSKIILIFCCFLLGFLIGAIFFIFLNKHLVYEKSFDPIHSFFQKNVFSPQKNNQSNDFLSFGDLPLLENLNFLSTFEKILIDQKYDFLKVDASEKKLFYFHSGQIEKEYNIIVMGKESFWSETPIGFYKIDSKEKRHFSSEGGVWMPYAMRFHGNYFIHGRTYFPDGTESNSQYSAGCITLSKSDAEDLFKIVKIGTPILIVNSVLQKDSFIYSLKGPEVSATDYLAVDLKNGQVLLRKSSQEKIPIFSLTKFMTAIVANEYIMLQKKINARNVGSSFVNRLKAGDSYSVFELLYPLLIESSDEAARNLSYFLGEEKFVEAMNARAKAIGMQDTSFFDPEGKDEKNKSTLSDLAIMARIIYLNKSALLNITKGQSTGFAGTNRFAQIYDDSNSFLDKKGYLGGKIGRSDEKEIKEIIAFYKIAFGSEERPIAVIVLGSQDRELDVNKIINFIVSNFKIQTQ